MQSSKSKQTLSAARASLAHRLSFEDFCARLSPKDKLNLEKRVAALEAENAADRARLWQRLACTMMTLAPHAAKVIGRQTVQFYIADGKYRMQVFALEDLQDGNLTAYCPDALDEAIAAGLLSKPDEGEEDEYVTTAGQTLRVESLTGSSINPAAHYKDMVGWNRKALAITLPPSASPAQLDATELLCAIAAQHFARPAAASAAVPVKV
jgi:hypothetical protein